MRFSYWPSAADGFDFEPAPQRIARLDEACRVIRCLLEGELSGFAGRYYRLEDAPLSPRPLQAHLALLIGGGGERLLLRVVARHADEWNVFATPEVLHRKLQALERHCDAAGRDASAIKRSVVLDPPRDRRGDTALLLRSLDAYAGLGVDEVVIRDSLLRAWGPGLPGSLACFMTNIAARFG